MTDTLTKLGRRVRYFRTGLGLSQESLAEKSGISTKYLSDLERGEANVSIQILERVAFGLKRTTIDLLDNEHEMERELLIKEIAEFLDTANDDKVRIAYRIIKSIL